MGLGVGRHNLKTFGTTVYGLTHPIGYIINNVHIFVVNSLFQK